MKQGDKVQAELQRFRERRWMGVLS
jgi:hypothetical protein